MVDLVGIICGETGAGGFIFGEDVSLGVTAVLRQLQKSGKPFVIFKLVYIWSNEVVVLK